MRKPYKAGVCASLLILAGCAGPSTQAPGFLSSEVASERLKQQEFLARAYVDQTARLTNVAYRVAVANRRDCGGLVGPKLGFQAISANEIPVPERQAWVSAFNLRPDRSTIIAVAVGSPAAKAGFVQGDAIVALDGEPLPSDNAGVWLAKQLKSVKSHKVRLTVERAGNTRTIDVTPVQSCTIPIVLARGSDANAFTDGNVIVIQTGLMRVAQTDAELALIVGHELAHVNMAHLNKRAQNQVAGAIGGAAVDVLFAVAGVNTGGTFAAQGSKIGGIAYAKEFEQEADYVGAYYAARAGYDIGGAERLWRAMAQENPKELTYAGIHPTSPERFVQMEKTVAEISAKQQRHAALEPERKKPPVQAVVTQANQGLTY